MLQFELTNLKEQPKNEMEDQKKQAFVDLTNISLAFENQIPTQSQDQAANFDQPGHPMEEEMI